MAKLNKNISVSQINTIMNCGHKFKLQYVLHLPPVTKSTALEDGSRIHSKISTGDFTSEVPEEQVALDRAKKFLGEMPPNPVMETSYEDKANPCRFYGVVLDKDAVAIADAIWDQYDIIADWKYSKAKSGRYAEQYERQAYFLAQLYEQKFGKPCKAIYFAFLKSDKIYKAKVLDDLKMREKVEKDIRQAISDMETGKLERNPGPLCSYCQYSAICNMDI